MKNVCKAHIVATYCFACFDNGIKIRDQRILVDGTVEVSCFIACRLLHEFFLQGIKE